MDREFQTNLIIAGLADILTYLLLDDKEAAKDKLAMVRKRIIALVEDKGVEGK